MNELQSVCVPPPPLRFSVDGLHSLQLTTPTKGQGFAVGPFNIRLTQDTKYELSFWAMARQSNLSLLFSFSDLTPTCEPAVFLETFATKMYMLVQIFPLEKNLATMPVYIEIMFVDFIIAWKLPHF